MGMLHQLNQWSITHHPRWLVILRVALGVSLFVKGISFIANSVELQTLLQQSNLPSSAWVSDSIAWIHLLGGAFIIIGFFTRLSIAVQIPILLVAVLFVNARQGMLGSSEFLFSLLILILLILFFIEGGGPLSMDDYFKRTRDK
jgi:uncharacterized membrane protein YphA (DoxX/SURF4 family)